MSYVVTPVLVDLKELLDSLGSRQEGLIARVVERSTEELTFDEDDETGRSELDGAIRDLVMGEPLDRFAPSRYQLAFELICTHLGEVILPDVWGGVQWDALSLVGLDEVLIKGPPISLPTDKACPRIGFLNASDIEAVVAKLGNSSLTGDDAELLEEYEGWLNEAASKNKSIVFFT